MNTEYLQLKKKPLHTKGLPKNEIQEGQKVEKEHTKCPRIAKQIAVDHLHEGTNYYQLLENMETKLKKADIATELDTLQKVQALKMKPKKIKKAFQIGFIKRAMEAGLTSGEAIDFLKEAMVPPADLASIHPELVGTVNPGAAALGALLGTGALMGAGGLAGNYVGKGLTTDSKNEKRNKTLGAVGGAISAPFLMRLLTGR